MSGNSEAAKKFAARMLEKNPNYYRELNAKSRQKWLENGSPPQGFKALSTERVKEISQLGVKGRKK